MDIQPNSKVLGAFVVGLALVAGAYTLSNFGEPSGRYAVVETEVTENIVPTRNAIAVLDEDNNGIEDWRDDFVTTEPIILDREFGGEYVPPDTLTGQIGIDFVQDIVRSRGHGELGRSDEEIITNTIKSLEQQTSHKIYDTLDIKTFNEWTDADIRSYANTIATAIILNSSTELEHELYILQDIINRNDESRIQELGTISELYRLTREAVLDTSVPTILAKEHLDLINTLHAIHIDIDGMTLTYDDPAYSLLRIKRYQEDAQGLYLSLQNMYLAFEPYADLFNVDDAAILFTSFSPSNNVRI